MIRKTVSSAKEFPAKSLHTKKMQAGFTMMEILVVVFIVAIMAGAISLTVNVNSTHRQLDKSFHRLNILLEYIQDQAIFRGRYMGLEFFSNGYRFLEIQEEDFDFLNSGLPKEHQEGYVGSDGVENGVEFQADPSIPDPNLPIDIDNREEELVEKRLSWKPVEQNRKLAAHSLPEGFSVILEIDGVILSLDELSQSQLADASSTEGKDTEENKASKSPSFKPQIIISQEGTLTPFKLIIAHDQDDIERKLELNTAGEMVEDDDETDDENNDKK